MDAPPFRIEETFGYALHHSSYLFKAALKDQFQEAGINLTPEEFVFLYLVPARGDTQNRLTKKSLKDKTTITRLVDRMVEKGYLHRRENDQNRREQILYLTQHALDLKQELDPLLKAFVTSATKGLEDQEIELARRTLNKLMLNLSR